MREGESDKEREGERRETKGHTDRRTRGRDREGETEERKSYIHLTLIEG